MPGKKGKIPLQVKKGAVDVADRIREIGHLQPHAVLATVGPDGPHTSLVAYALTPDQRDIIFATPRKTRKYRNIKNDPRVSLLIDTRSNTAYDYLGAESLTAKGYARLLRKSKRRDELQKVFLKKHPDLRGFLRASTTAFVLVKVERFTHVSRFQSVSVLDIRHIARENLS